MTDHLSDAHVSPERLDELILWFSVGDRPSVGKDAFDALRELKALRKRCERPCDGYAYRYHSPFGSGMTFIAFEYTEARGKPIESIPYWLGSPSSQGDS